MVSKVFHTCTAGLYRNYFNQSSTQQVTKVALPLIALGVACLYIHRLWTATTQITPPHKSKPVASPNPVASELQPFLPTDFEYNSDLPSIQCSSTRPSFVPDSMNEAEAFFEKACDQVADKDNRVIRVWEQDNPRKLTKALFMRLAQSWIDRKGHIFCPEKGKPVVVDKNATCSPWCHEGKNRSPILFDLLRRAGIQKVLLPEGVKSGYLNPERIQVEDAVDLRFPAIQATTGFRGSVTRIGDRLDANNINLQQKGFTNLFNQLATLNEPVMIFAFISAVPILMREIMQRTGDKDLSHITIVAFHHDDPNTCETPLNPENANQRTPWVIENNLQELLRDGQKAYEVWNRNKAELTALRKEKGPYHDDVVEKEQLSSTLAAHYRHYENELQVHQRVYQITLFQEELAQLIYVEN